MSANTASFDTVRALTPPSGVASIPLVLDSPHSGTHYPDDFGFSCDFTKLRQAEDTLVDDLFASAVPLGATLVCAQFPRSYIDPNRRVEDLDVSMIDGKWPGPIKLSPKTSSGIGLIWKTLGEREPIYSRKLSVEEVERRIFECHFKYWMSLRIAHEAAFAAHGRVFHINCHSMPADTSGSAWLASKKALADVVLGDRDGSTCAPDFTMLLHDAFRAEGLSVAINDPYKGVELVKQFGKPQENKHSIQVEINRRLYLNETTREANAGFEATKALIDRVLKQVARYVQR